MIVRDELSCRSICITVLLLAGVVTSARCDAQASGWSESVAGVRGRLVIMGSGPQISVDLELENVSAAANNIEIWWSNAGGMLDFQLVDERGKPIPNARDFGDELQPFPTWLILPRASSLRVTLHPVGLSAGRLRLPNFQAWDLSHQPPGTLCLRATFTPRAAPASANPARRPWVGPLTLPCAPLQWDGASPSER